jgi:Xaa-Pro dipeptidase
MPDYAARIRRARARMDELGIDLLYLSPGANAQYLSGWRRHRPHFGNVNYPGGWVQGLLLGPTVGPILAVPRMVADFDLEPDAPLEPRVLPDRGDPQEFLAALLRDVGPKIRSVAIENRAWAELAVGLRRALPDAEPRLASEVLAPLRMVKDVEELELLHHAGQIVQTAMAEIVPFLRPDSDQTELDVALELERLMLRQGAQAPSFVTNVWQMGPGEERPLAMKVSRRRLERGNSLCFDFGSVYEGYCYDFGRAVFLGEPPAEYRRAYDLVMQSAQAGIEALQDGRFTAEEVNARAREVIREGGYDDYFRHRLGHGIGLDVHEPPYLDRGDQTVLRSGMCFTVEPSIFITGRFGARTEDVVVVQEHGGRLLTDYRRDLQVVE